MFNRYRSLWICLALALLTLAVFWRIRENDFISFDDDIYITDQKNVQSGLTWQMIKWAFTSVHAYNWHPLTTISHMLDCRLYGLDPAGHHLTNVLFHAANSMLLFLLLGRITGCMWRSAFVAALFALHPLHVESVAWASERKDVLSCFFWILTMWSYVRYTRSPRLSRYLAVLAFFALGLMSKQMLVTLPFVLLLLDYWPLRRFPQAAREQHRSKVNRPAAAFARCFAEKVPLLILSAAASVVVFVIQSKVTLVKTTLAIPVTYRLGNALVVYAGYIAKMFWPAGLAGFYPHPEDNLPFRLILLSVLLLLSVSVVAFRLRRTHRWFLVGWLWYLGTLVPVIGLVQIGLHSMADRYTYIPLIGLFVVVSWAAADLFGKLRNGRIVLAIGAVSVLSILTVLTWVQLGYWRDSITLCEHTLAVTKNNDLVHYSLGQLKIRQNKIDEAIEHWAEALRIRPNQPTLHKNLAMLQARRGRFDGAVEHYKEAIRLRPNDVIARGQLGLALAELRRTNEAIEQFRIVLNARPDDVQMYCNLGILLERQAKPAEAIVQYRRALQIDPDNTTARQLLEAASAKQETR